MKHAILASLALFLFGCASRPTSDISRGDAENAIRSMDAAFNAAVSRADVNGMMETYSDDAVLMPPNLPAMHGRDAIRGYWSSILGLGRVDAIVSADDVTQSGDLATEVGHYTLTITPANGGAAMNDKGKYILCWRKTGGKWRAYADIFNSDLPVQR